MQRGEDCFESTSSLFMLATNNNLGIAHLILNHKKTASMSFLVDCGEGEASDVDKFPTGHTCNCEFIDHLDVHTLAATA
jgi:hypothetical protein